MPKRVNDVYNPNENNYDIIPIPIQFFFWNQTRYSKYFIFFLFIF